MKGCICLDIDGTLTVDPFHIPLEVIECLQKLYTRGWGILFSTGRPFAFAHKLFDWIPFPFYLSLQNGSDLLQMPEKKPLSKQYLSSRFIPALESLYEGICEDFVIYSGWERGDFCYFRPKKFSPKMLEHIEVIQALSSEPWREVEEFSFPQETLFPLIKGLGTKEQMETLQKKLEEIEEVHATCIYDPLSKTGSYLNLITSCKATKGEVIKTLRPLFPEKAIFIAAGDDRNDISMFQEADFAIVMKTAPEEVVKYADLIAEPAQEKGIIKALWTATGEKP